MATVYQIGDNWEYIESLEEKDSKDVSRSMIFCKAAFVAITDRMKAQVCIIKQKEKYGLYTADHTVGMGGPGSWRSPGVEPFQYDEIKYCVDPFKDKPGLFAFRIADKWGITEVVDGDLESDIKYDYEYPLTKRRILVPCEYNSIEEADAQPGASHEWKEPLFNVDSPQH